MRRRRPQGDRMPKLLLRFLCLAHPLVERAHELRRSLEPRRHVVGAAQAGGRVVVPRQASLLLACRSNGGLHVAHVRAEHGGLLVAQVERDPKLRGELVEPLDLRRRAKIVGPAGRGKQPFAVVVGGGGEVANAGARRERRRVRVARGRLSFEPTLLLDGAPLSSSSRKRRSSDSRGGCGTRTRLASLPTCIRKCSVEIVPCTSASAAPQPPSTAVQNSPAKTSRRRRASVASAQGTPLTAPSARAATQAPRTARERDDALWLPRMGLEE